MKNVIEYFKEKKYKKMAYRNKTIISSASIKPKKTSIKKKTVVKKISKPNIYKYYSPTNTIFKQYRIDGDKVLEPQNIKQFYKDWAIATDDRKDSQVLGIKPTRSNRIDDYDLHYLFVCRKTKSTQKEVLTNIKTSFDKIIAKKYPNLNKPSVVAQPIDINRLSIIDDN